MTASRLHRYRLPATFRSLNTLRVLNVLAVAGSLAAMTGSVFAHVFGSANGASMAASTISTFIVGLVWAVVMRMRRTLPNTPTRLGWVLSVPLAALNGALACGLLAGAGHADRFVSAFLLGGSVGAIFWVPGLLVVLTVFGIPIARSQKLAANGLAGEERGEFIVGLVSVAIALIAFIIVPPADQLSMTEELSFAARPLVLGGVALGGLGGLVAALLAAYREHVRRAFVREVEAGAVEGFRVDATTDGKVLVRVTTQGGGYRAASFEEQVYGLDEAGDAGRALSSEH